LHELSHELGSTV